MAENRIGAERTRLRMSQEDLAEKLDISRNTLSKYEKNPINAPLRKLVEMANLFSCSTDYLLGRTDERRIR